VGKTHRIHVDGNTLVATEHNPEAAGTPIIFVHGILANIFAQESVLAEVLADNHWYSLSLPGHYPATVNQSFFPHELTPEFMGHIMSEAIRQLTGGKPARLMGHSTGGYVALTVAHTAPELVEDICLVGGFAVGRWGSPVLRSAQIMANLPFFGRIAFTAYMSLSINKPPLTHLFFRLAAHNQQAMRQNPHYEHEIALAVRDYPKLDLGAIYPYFRVMPHTSIMHWLQDISHSVTILHGDHDPVIPPQHARRMAQALPNRQVHWIAQSGHLPFLENFEVFTRLVRAWVAQTSADSEAQAFNTPVMPISRAESMIIH